MKAMVIGGYSFAGSHISERFYKEGYNVLIADSANFEKYIKPNFPHYFINLSDSSCHIERIIKAERPDILVYCIQPNIKTTDDFNAKMALFSKIAEGSVIHSVPKFIMLSTTDIYSFKKRTGEINTSNYNDLSVLFLNSCEELSLKWRGKHNLSTVILRCPQIYGPRQSLKSKDDIMVQLLKMIEKKAFEEDRDKLYALIYIGDVADAAVKSISDIANGIYNVMPDEAAQYYDIITAASLITGLNLPLELHYTSDAKIEDNTKTKKELNWTPIVSLGEGIRRTFDWYFNDYKKYLDEMGLKIGKVKAERNWPSIVIPYLENFALFALMYLLNTIQTGLSIDFCILYVIIMGIFHGIKHSMIAAVLSSFLVFVSRMATGMDFTSVLYDLNIIFTVVQYLIIGASVGYVVERKNTDIAVKNDSLERLQEDYTYLINLYEETANIKEEFEYRILEYGDSYGRILSIVSMLDSLKPEEIIMNAFTVIKELMKEKNITIYMINNTGTFMRLSGKTGEGFLKLPRSVRLADYPVWEEIIEKREVYTNNNLNPEMPSMVSPIIFDGKIIALIIIADMKFEKLTLYYKNLLKVVSNLISSAISKAQTYERAIISKKFIKDTPIFTVEEFRDLLDVKNELVKKGYSEYTLLRVTNCFDERNKYEVSHKIVKAIRENDQLGIGEDGGLYVLLSGTNETDANVVVERLGKIGIETVLF